MSGIPREAFNEILDLMGISDELKIKYGERIKQTYKEKGNPVGLLLEMAGDEESNRNQLAGLAFLLGATIARPKTENDLKNTMPKEKLECYLDGNALCIVRSGFKDLQASDCVFIDLTEEQKEGIEKLQAEKEMSIDKFDAQQDAITKEKQKEEKLGAERKDG